MRTVVMVVVLCGSIARAQVFAGCTPDSMAVARAGSLAATEFGRWSCYARNLGTTPAPVSRAGFALDFLELHMADTADVSDVFTQKQKMSRWAKIARTCEWIGVGAGIVVGISGIDISARAVGAIGAATYGAAKFGDYATKQIPLSENALANQWGPQDTIVLAPGAAISWKVYASKMQGAKSIGPKSLTMPGTEPGAPKP